MLALVAAYRVAVFTCPDTLAYDPIKPLADTSELLTTVVPILRSAAVKLAIDDTEATVTKLELAAVFTVEFPTKYALVVIPTFEPTLTTPVLTDVEFARVINAPLAFATKVVETATAEVLTFDVPNVSSFAVRLALEEELTTLMMLDVIEVFTSVLDEMPITLELTVNPGFASPNPLPAVKFWAFATPVVNTPNPFAVVTDAMLALVAA